jgi:hypothetical protein
VVPQVDSAQLLQTLLNQLVISSQLNTQQSAPLASQSIGQTVDGSNPCSSSPQAYE